MRGGAADAEGVDEAAADGGHDGGEDHDGDVVAEHGDHDAGDDGEERAGEDEGQVADAGLGGADAIDGLEVDGEVVEEDEEEAADGDDVEGHD